MTKERMEQISLAVVSYHKAKGTIKMPDLISQTEALELVLDRIKKFNDLRIVCGESLVGISSMADKLCLPRKEYYEYNVALRNKLNEGQRIY